MHAGKNQAPTSTEQGISRSMRDLMRRTEQAKEMKKKSRKQKKEIMKKRFLAQLSTQGAERELLEVPDFKRGKGEKAGEFMRRVDAAAMIAIKESQIEAGFKNQPDPIMEEPRVKAAKRKEKLKVKKQQKKEKRKEKEEDRYDDFDKFKDEVKFGEVVHDLPSLTVRPKHAAAQEKPQVKSLLLYDIIQKNRQDSNHDSSHSTSSVSTQKTKSSRELGKGMKRKLMSPAQKNQMDKERESAIALYRQMKKNSSSGSGTG